MNRQAELERLLAELADEFAEMNEKQVAKAIRNMRKVNGTLADILAELAEDEGTISRRKLAQALREIEATSGEYREALMTELESAIRESAEFAVDRRNEIFLTVLGVALISTAVQRKEIVDTVTRRLMRQKGADLLNLSDRVWILSGDMLADLTKTVRADILKQEAVSTMIRNIRKVQDNDTWKIRRLVVNEANTAYRKSTGESAHKSEVVTAIKLNDNGHRHARHDEHACYALANANDYGLGRGVYPTSERERLEMPHVQCSSYITDVINERYLNGE